jgi:hypothetical protein
LSELEYETFGFTHAQAGAYLLSLWGFPSEVVSAVAAHDAMPAATDERNLSWLVQVANKAADAHLATLCGPPDAGLAPEWFEELGVGAPVAQWAAERSQG